MQHGAFDPHGRLVVAVVCVVCRDVDPVGRMPMATPAPTAAMTRSPLPKP